MNKTKRLKIKCEMNSHIAHLQELEARQAAMLIGNACRLERDEALAYSEYDFADLALSYSIISSALHELSLECV